MSKPVPRPASQPLCSSENWSRWCPNPDGAGRTYTSARREHGIKTTSSSLRLDLYQVAAPREARGLASAAGAAPFGSRIEYVPASGTRACEECGKASGLRSCTYQPHSGMGPSRRAHKCHEEHSSHKWDTPGWIGTDHRMKTTTGSSDPSMHREHTGRLDGDGERHTCGSSTEGALRPFRPLNTCHDLCTLSHSQLLCRRRPELRSGAVSHP
jgi:hypothetical protein